jgi:hemolysin activation/secretion protein
LIARAFVDAGEVLQSHKVTGEYDDTLCSAGAGLELQLKQNIDIRGDWGIVLAGLGGRVGVGASRFTLLVTLLY